MPHRLTIRWAALLLALLFPAPAARAQDSARVQIVFLDVGQGDAALVIAPEGRTALIDAGPADAGVARRLEALGVDTLDLAVASHAHADHIGGMAEVVRTFPVRAYLDNGTPYTTATYRDLMHAVESTKVPYLAPVGRTVVLGSVALRVLPPWPSGTDQNDCSVGMLLEFGAFRALFVGDAEAAELGYFLTLEPPQVTVLKAAHHGARNGVTPGWIARTRPAVVVISVGAGNPYGHPDSSALRYYSALGATVLRTDRDGTIAVRGARDGSYELETRYGRSDTAR
jgi:competence protein ComEC